MSNFGKCAVVVEGNAITTFQKWKGLSASRKYFQHCFQVPQLDYCNLTGSVHNGGEAMTIFPKIKDMAPADQQKARQSLLDYCHLDTLAMVKIWQKLEEIGR